ncbi:hypothetical protein [uncultured Citricoccus sp.]|uniref:hypothetical protein n=1 Tax=uncultured Citricoccus sp. TaxID=614031 RepID=UPI00343154E3
MTSSQHRTPRLPVTVRRGFVVGICALAALLGWGMQDGYQQSRAYYGHLVETAPRIQVTVTGRQLYRGGYEYDVSLEGRKLWLGFPENVPDGTAVGDDVEVVVDPEDPEYAVAVGTPEDWAPDPKGEAIEFWLMVTTLVGMSGWAAYKLLPEDRARLAHSRVWDWGKVHH